MILFPLAKINIGLNVLNKRHDGFHEIETCMIPIPLFDVLEVKKQKEFQFVQTGIPINDQDNLCVRAYDILNRKHKIKPVYIHLHKHIPIGAGLGGGSSDAAFILKALNELYSLGISNNELEEISEELGSDCPFFIDSKPKHCTGKGGKMKDLNIDLEGLYLEVVNPSIQINTKYAYSLLNKYVSSYDLLSKMSNPINEWKNKLNNSFEKPIFNIYPELEIIKKEMYERGAIFSSMSGSGSTIYGLYNENPSSSYDQSRSYLHIVAKL